MDVDEEKLITRIPMCLPPRKGKAKVRKDLGLGKFTMPALLFPEEVVFEGALLARIPVLKLEDWDLSNHEKFLHFTTNKYMTKIYYEETGVTRLEPMKWVKWFEQARLLHMLCVPHFHRSIINTICVCQFLALVHDGCLWLGEPIPITNMLIHRITKLPYKGEDLAKEFGGKSKEEELVDKMRTMDWSRSCVDTLFALLQTEQCSFSLRF